MESQRGPAFVLHPQPWHEQRGLLLPRGSGLQREELTVLASGRRQSKAKPQRGRQLEVEHVALFALQKAKDVACWVICVPQFLQQLYADLGKCGQ
jgi:hypothetical protein